MFSKLKKVVDSAELAEDSALEPLAEGLIDQVAGAGTCMIEVVIGHRVKMVPHGGYPPEV